jgi:hypothetical protein
VKVRRQRERGARVAENRGDHLKRRALHAQEVAERVTEIVKASPAGAATAGSRCWGVSASSKRTVHEREGAPQRTRQQ